MSHRILFVFLDGVGIGPADPDVNPFLRARIPVLTELLGGSVPTLDEPLVGGPRGRSLALDATLGMEGLPQSGTGQTSLLTGRNTARVFGRHFGPWTPVRLRPLLAEENVLVRTLEAGRGAAFANAYPREWPGERASRFPAAPPLAARQAGLLTRHAEALGRGEAVASEILNTGWRDHLGHRELPSVTATEAGANLARIAGEHHLTLFAHYDTDYAGHEGGMERAVDALERVDAFLGGVLAELPADVLLILASDHGNLEDIRTSHTRNPALGIVAVGDGAAGEGLPCAELDGLTDVAPWILGTLAA